MPKLLACWTVGCWSRIYHPTRHRLGHLGSSLHSQSLDWYWQTKQHRKIHKLIIIRKQRKIQQNQTTLVQSPLTTLGQEMRWVYSTLSTVLLSPYVHSPGHYITFTTKY